MLDAMERSERNDPTVSEEHPGFSETPSACAPLDGGLSGHDISRRTVIAGADRVSPTRSEAAFAGLIATR